MAAGMTFSLVVILLLSYYNCRLVPAEQLSWCTQEAINALPRLIAVFGTTGALIAGIVYSVWRGVKSSLLLTLFVILEIVFLASIHPE
jgi:hypothetical protein